MILHYKTYIMLDAGMSPNQMGVLTHVGRLTGIPSRLESSGVQKFLSSTHLQFVLAKHNYRVYWLMADFVLGFTLVPTASQCTADHENGKTHQEQFSSVRMHGGREHACGPLYLYYYQ